MLLPPLGLPLAGGDKSNKIPASAGMTIGAGIRS